ncbi:carbohydrate-binding module family 18 protein [Piromyces sp. E2]|nr:carbohydrate-binding module family 18 protein [Piromyces sp. E2]|eukprot:OUM68743.1 carbohydrate-binding module family 18 protein [Piromyces sp. E2]
MYQRRGNRNKNVFQKCGKIDGEKVKCPEGQCCSKDGVCGTTPDFCSIEKECQSEFGECFVTCDELLKKIPIQKVDDEDDTYCENNENGYVNSLKITSTEIETLPSFENLTSLEEILIHDNKLKSLPEGLENLPNLNTLDISRNCFECPVKPNIESLEQYTCIRDEASERKCLPKCGEIDGEKVKCPKGQCCSKDGVCGTTPDFCSIEKECQSEFGECFITCDELLKKFQYKK